MIAFRAYTLPNQDLQPAWFGKQIIGPPLNPPGFTKKLDLMAQAVRDRHVLAMQPKGGVGAFIGVIVQDQEVSDQRVFLNRLLIILIAQNRVASLRREEGDEAAYRGLDQMDRGRFQRLHKATGKADRDTILVPKLFPAARDKLQRPWISQRLAVEIGYQDALCFLIAGESTAIDMAIAYAMLQRNPPLPASVARGCACIGRQRRNRLTRHGEGTVTGE